MPPRKLSRVPAAAAAATKVSRFAAPTPDNVLTLDDLFVDRPNIKLVVPELPKNGQPGILWLRYLPADVVTDYFDDQRVKSESLTTAEEKKIAERRTLRGSMLEFIRQSVVRGEHDNTLILAHLTDEQLRTKLPMSLYNRLVSKVTEMCGFDTKAAEEAGKDSDATPTAVSPSV